MNRQIITSPAGERLVVLPEAEYDRLVEAAEMTADVAAYDTVKRKLARGEEELLPAEMTSRMLDGENPIRIWREHRNFTAKALAARAGIAPAYLSQIEAGRRDGTIETMRKIAEALKVGIDDLIG